MQSLMLNDYPLAPGSVDLLASLPYCFPTYVVVQSTPVLSCPNAVPDTRVSSCTPTSWHLGTRTFSNDNPQAHHDTAITR